MLKGLGLKVEDQEVQIGGDSGIREGEWFRVQYFMQRQDWNANLLPFAPAGATIFESRGGGCRSRRRTKQVI